MQAYFSSNLNRQAKDSNNLDNPTTDRRFHEDEIITSLWDLSRQTICFSARMPAADNKDNAILPE
jgi:hypothetical protein